MRMRAFYVKSHSRSSIHPPGDQKSVCPSLSCLLCRLYNSNPYWTSAVSLSCGLVAISAHIAMWVNHRLLTALAYSGG